MAQCSLFYIISNCANGTLSFKRKASEFLKSDTLVTPASTFKNQNQIFIIVAVLRRNV